MKNFTTYSVIMNVFLSCVVIFMIIKFQNLHSENIEVGDKVESITIKSLGGDDETLVLKDSTFIFFMSTSCPICIDNIEEWNKMYDTLGSSYKIIGLCEEMEIEKIIEYIVNNNVQFPIYTIQRGFASSHKIRGVPTFLLIENNIIKRLWVGKTEVYDFYN